MLETSCKFTYLPHMTATPINELNDRAQDIFRVVVEAYLESGAPVGSRTISKISALELSPASIRNVMQDLEELGLLAAPHTSAGRMPTDLPGANAKVTEKRSEAYASYVTQATPRLGADIGLRYEWSTI